MSHFDAETNVSRRQVLLGAVSLAVGCVLDCEAVALQVPDVKLDRALDDPAVSHGLVEFQGGHERIAGYLARSKKEGRFPIVLVITGSSLADEYIPNTTAMLAQAGFIGFAPDIFSLQKGVTTVAENRQILADKITDDYIFANLDGSLAFLARQEYAKPERVGVMGFCFGGRCALMYATHAKAVRAVAPFYGILKTPPFAKREFDPLDVAGSIRAPIQGHYAKSDEEIPLSQLSQFEHDLKAGGTNVEICTYDAKHGFFAYNRSTYDAKAAAESWKKTVAFFKAQLLAQG